MAAKMKNDFPVLDERLHDSFLHVLKIHDADSSPKDSVPSQGTVTLRKEKQGKAMQKLNTVKQKADKTCQSLLYQQRKSIGKKEEICTEVTKYFASLRDKMNKYLYKEEQRFLDELDTQYKEDESELDEILSWCRSLQKTMEHDGHVVDHVDFNDKIGENKGKSLGNAFDDVIDKLQTCDEAISKIKRPSNMKRFVHNEEAETQALSLKFGSWEGNDETLPEKEQNPELQNVQEPLKYAVLESSFQTRLDVDSRNPAIGGLAWVKDMVLTLDRYNKKLKLLDQSGVMLATVVFQGGDPSDITTGEEGTGVTYAYIAVPNDKQIVTVRVLTSKSLEFGGKIPTPTGYCSLAFDKKKTQLVCGCCSPYGRPRVDIITTTGVVLTSFALDPAGKPLFSFPRSIDIEGDVIIVCDWNKNKLVFLRNDGYIMGSYNGTRETPLRDPMGTALDGRGHVMVADCKSRMIHIIKIGGGFVARLDVGVPLTGPREIASYIKEDVSKLAISHGGSLVEVFDLLKDNPSASAPSYYDDYDDDYYDDYDDDYYGDPPKYDDVPKGDNKSHSSGTTIV